MKRRKIKIWLSRLGDKLAGFLPDWCCGRRSVLEQKYGSIYGNKDWKERAAGERRRTACQYLAVLCVFFPFLVGGALGEILEWQESDVAWLMRPDYGQHPQTEQLEAELKYGTYSVKKDVGLTLNPRMLTEAQKKKYLKKTAASLNKKILGNNTDLLHIEEDLHLPSSENGVQIQWYSDCPEVLDENGKLYLLAAENGQKVNLTAVLTMDELTEQADIPITVCFPEEKDLWQEALKRELEETLEHAKESGSTENDLLLPRETKNGIPINWKRSGGGRFFPILVLFLAALVAVYGKRYRRADRQLAEIKASVQRDLPELINKLILLLSAGLVIDTAIEKITEDYFAFRENGRKKSYLYEALAEVQKRVCESNAFLAKELFEMARRSGVQEFMRFTSIIGDNMQKGNALSEKLEAEAAMLWQARKKQAESKGRIAETKLTFPLTILLSVLVVITIAPTLM